MLESVFDLVILFENYLLVAFLYFLCKKKINFLSVIMTIVISFESIFLNYICFDETFSLLVLFLSLFVFGYLCLKENVLHAFFSSVLTIINLTVIKIIVIFASYFVIDGFLLESSSYQVTLLLTCISIGIQAFEYLYLKYFYKRDIVFSKKIIYILCFTFGLIVVAINIILRAFIKLYMNYELSLFLIILCIVFMLLMIYMCISHERSFQKILEQNLLIESYQFEQEITQQLKIQIDQYNQLKHDTKNHFNVLLEMLSQEQYNKAFCYLDQAQNLIPSSHEYIYVDNMIVNYIINNKMNIAKDHGIDVKCVIQGNVQDYIADVDYNIILSNLLDNAIEAAVQSKDKIIAIEIKFLSEKTIIKISNSYLKTLDINDLVTTKNDKKNHGFGLKNINHIVEKYKGHDSIKIENNMFYHICILYNQAEEK